MVPRQLGILDKGVHFSIYAVLGFLTGLALRQKWSAARVVAAVVVGIAVFGALDEWHQQFIAGRSTEFADWVADVIGGTVGTVLAATQGPRWTKRQA